MPVVDTPPPDSAYFDYIIIGSGAGGAPLAARLAEEFSKRSHAPPSILVLEAGPDQLNCRPDEGRREVSEVPALHGPSTEHKELSWRFFVKHYTDAATYPGQTDPKWYSGRDGGPDADGHWPGIFYPRTTGIGGCTIHNAMITIAGPASDWDDLARLVNDRSWEAEFMRGYFQRLEHCDYYEKPRRVREFWPRFWDTLLWLIGRDEDPTLGRHGFDGWLHTSFVDLNIALKGDRKDKYLIKMLGKAAAVSFLHGMESKPLRLAKRVLQGEAYEELDPNHFRRQTERPEGIVLIPTAIHGAQCAAPNPNPTSRQPAWDEVRGRRSSVYNRIRSAAEKYPSLTIATNCLATRILFQKTNGQLRASGVQYRHGLCQYEACFKPSDQKGEERTVHANKEIILAGGTFNTPQLLMLSGIGPASQVSQHGIEQLVDLPGVGQNLQDRYEVSIVSKLAGGIDYPLVKDVSFALPDPGGKIEDPLKDWRTDGRGLYSSNGAVLGIFKRSKPDLEQPDLFIFGIPLRFWGYQVGYSKVKERNLFTWAILKGRTSNVHGTVELNPADPANPLKRPIINFHSFERGCSDCDRDVEAVIRGIHFVREIVALSGNKEIPPDKTDWIGETDAQLTARIKRDAWGHHACGTCRMGRPEDPLAVLDSQFRVYDALPIDGTQRKVVKGLRVVDASIFPKIPGYFIVANIYMASEKAADVILQSH